MEEQQCHLWWVFLFAFLFAAASLFSNPSHFDSSLFPISGVSLVPNMSFSFSLWPICLSPDSECFWARQRERHWFHRVGENLLCLCFLVPARRKGTKRSIHILPWPPLVMKQQLLWLLITQQNSPGTQCPWWGRTTVLLLPHLSFSKQSNKPPSAWLGQGPQLVLKELFMLLFYKLTFRLDVHFSVTPGNCVSCLFALAVVPKALPYPGGWSALQSVFWVISLRLAD